MLQQYVGNSISDLPIRDSNHFFADTKNILGENGQSTDIVPDKLYADKKYIPFN